MRSGLDASIHVEWLTNPSKSSSWGLSPPSGLVRHSYTCAQTNTQKYSEISLKGNIYRFELWIRVDQLQVVQSWASEKSFIGERWLWAKNGQCLIVCFLSPKVIQCKIFFLPTFTLPSTSSLPCSQRMLLHHPSICLWDEETRPCWLIPSLVSQSRLEASLTGFTLWSQQLRSH